MFAHRPLERQNREIRLVRFVVPRAGCLDMQTRIALELRHASMNDNVPYAAVSYVWGDVSDTTEAEVNGELYPIGLNLHMALHKLRQRRVDSWLWVDSLCIQQNDAEEKSWQVNQMRDIFLRASPVYMWLGQGTGESNIAMDFVSRMGPRALAAGALDLSPFGGENKAITDDIEKKCHPRQGHEDAPMRTELARVLLELLYEEGLNGEPPRSYLCIGISNILQRDYWHRIWIIQEISFTKGALVLCGEKSESFEAFVAILNAIWYCKQSNLSSLLPEFGNFGTDLDVNLYKIRALDVRWQYFRRDQIRLVDILFEKGAAPGRPYYSASDPRDIVFGLLGVVSDGQQLGIYADYSKTSVEIFMMLTRALIRYGDENSCQFHLDCCTPRKDAGSLPTWVPDWRLIGRYGLRVFPINHLGVFEAAAGMPFPTPAMNDRTEDPMILRRSGCQVDVITEVMQPPKWVQHDEWAVSKIRDTDRWLSSVFVFAGLGPQSGPAEDYVWRTILQDQFDRLNRPNRPMSEETAQLIRKIMRREHIDPGTLTEGQIDFIRSVPRRIESIPGLENLSDQIEWFTSNWPEAVGTANRGRTLFRTAKGLFGLGHVAIRSGDVVSLLGGVKSPIVLRPRDSGSFSFLGDAYVDGIMYGEYLKTGPVYKDFDIY